MMLMWYVLPCLNPPGLSYLLWPIGYKQTWGRASQVGSVVKIEPADAENTGDKGSVLSWEDPLEEEMSSHPRILAWRIPWTEDLGGLPSIELLRVGHN